MLVIFDVVFGLLGVVFEIFGVVRVEGLLRIELFIGWFLILVRKFVVCFDDIELDFCSLL